MPNAPAYDPLPRARRWPWALLGFLLSLVAIDQTYRLFIHSQSDTELNPLRKEGYPVTARELAKWHTPLPDKENGAIAIMEAVDNLSLPRDAFNHPAWGRT